MKSRGPRPMTVVARAIVSFHRLVEPRSSGLPNWRVVTWFPLFSAFLVLILVVFQLSGTSSGAHWLSLGSGTDPRLLFGAPRAVRSDEWLVQQSWIVSQAAHGYPAFNTTFPGGLDMTVLDELPSWDWSSFFRPHLWGYLLFGLDVGVSWYWWVPALAVVCGCYLFVTSILPRRPFTAAFLSIAVFFAPFLQWWYTPSTLWPVAWALLALVATTWTLKDPRHWVRTIWAALVGYFAVTMAMSMYVPFMLQAVFLVLVFAIGAMLRSRLWRQGEGFGIWGRFWPVVTAAAVSVVVVVLWVLTRLDTFDAIQSTVYPGERLFSTGALLTADPHLTGIGGAIWSQALKTPMPNLLGLNSSEGSSVFLLALVLLPGLIWLTVDSFRRSRRVDWLVAMCILGFVVVAAYLLLPGWDAVAHLVFLDRIAPERFRMFFVLLLPVFAALTIEGAEANRAHRAWLPAATSTVFAVAFIYVLWHRISTLDPAILVVAWTWIPVALLFTSATFLFFIRRCAPIAAAMLMVATLLTTGNVNPLYRGIYDLRATKVGEAVESLEAQRAGTWVGVGSYSTMAVLVETGVESLSGVQTYPPDEMWDEIDPHDRYENVWNRLAHIHWSFGIGEPQMTNPQADVISVTLDPCSDFAQENVSYVLADAKASNEKCLVQVADIQQGARDMQIYKIAPRD